MPIPGMKSFLLLAWVLALTGCNNVVSKEPAPTQVHERVTWKDVWTLVFDAYDCAKCHGKVAGYSVETRDEAIKSAKLCEYLEKGYMPPKGAVPDAEDAKMVCDWLEAGAP